MCFSATASFIASGVLVSCGTVAIIKYRFSKKELALAIIPIVFGLHQFVEGVVWLGLIGTVGADIQNVAAHLFTFIAMCFWPIFIPLALLLYEYPKRRLPLFSLLVLGTAISSYLFWCFSIHSHLYVNVQCCNSLSYNYHLPYLYGVIDYFYVAVVVVPYLFSSNPRVKYLLAPGFLFSFLIALALESGGDYPSIWCFLAALLSISIIYSLKWKKGI